jgi:hypothetical protein
MGARFTPNQDGSISRLEIDDGYGAGEGDFWWRIKKLKKEGELWAKVVVGGRLKS